MTENGTNVFDPVEATITDIRAAIEAGELTATEIVTRHLSRIRNYDDSINTLITVNDAAVERAQQLDQAFEESGFVGPLHGVPLVIKDNIDTRDLPTTGGTAALAGSVPTEDAVCVARLREAGGVVVGKSNLPDLTRDIDGYSSVSGQTRNPYDTERIPGGSSSGTAACVAANLAMAGLGTETGVSIRNPAANNGLVGIAPTRGLVSRTGVLTISFTQDRVGPHARTVRDAACLLDVVAGYDERDPRTARSVDRPAGTYTDHLAEDGLDGARVGVVRQLFAGTVGSLIDETVDEIAGLGATMVDPVPVEETLRRRLPVLDPAYPGTNPDLIGVLENARTNDYENRLGMGRYLRERADIPYDSVSDVLETGGLRQSVAEMLQSLPEDGVQDSAYYERVLRINALQDVIYQTMARDTLDALVFPPKSSPPPRIGDTPDDPSGLTAGNILGSITGFPSVVVPAGFTDDGLPVAVEFLGRPFTEKRLLELAYAYEQGTTHRTAPDDFGLLE